MKKSIFGFLLCCLLLGSGLILLQSHTTEKACPVPNGHYFERCVNGTLYMWDLVGNPVSSGGLTCNFTGTVFVWINNEDTGPITVDCNGKEFDLATSINGMTLDDTFDPITPPTVSCDEVYIGHREITLGH